MNTIVESDPEANPKGLLRLPAPAQETARSSQLSARPTAVWEVILQIGSDNVPPVRLEIAQHSIIGRADPAEGFIPNIDLTAFGAKEMGISRRHATLTPALDRLLIRDLNSMNGTFINGAGLAADELYTLHAGDEIRLASLRMLVYVLRPVGSGHGAGV